MSYVLQEDMQGLITTSVVDVISRFILHPVSMAVDGGQNLGVKLTGHFMPSWGYNSACFR